MASFDADINAVEVINKLASHAEGKTFVITGTSKGGLGAETAMALARAKPKQIILAARTEAKVNPVIEEIKKINSSVKVTFVQIDLLDNSSVRKAAEKVLTMTDKIHGLINNAGVMAVRTYVTSKDGIESQFAANHVGHFLLTNLLMPQVIAAGKGAIVVNVASSGYQLAELNIQDSNFQEGKTYNAWRAYGASKTANILFTYALALRVSKKGVAVLAVHPGVVLESLLLPNSGVTEDFFMEAYKLAIERNDGNPLPPQTTKTLQQGAACILVAALDPSFRESSPALLVENQVAEAKEYATSEANAEGLWKLSERLVGEKFNI
ncbi:hypothetical protein MMC26_001231 [Xylographa opegraphella]|nr:hypothetical protein [Xylographa opegraphella]